VLAEADALALLGRGRIEIEGRLTDASNTTLRAEISLDGLTRRCVYKPVRGERPLWDFPDGTLAGREVSAYLVSRATGWDLVPPTILRDGPLGPGALQLWIDEPAEVPALIGFVPAYDVPVGWFPVAAARDDDGDAYALAHADDPRLARLAVFDAVINNADRKGAHVLYPSTGGVHGVDHGVSFHVENKLRTVLWGWTGKPFPEDAVATLTRLREQLTGPLGAALEEHLTITEVQHVGLRVKRLLRSRRFPQPPSDWPAIPWPPI
jgi:uncharacterized repeat protein (TIGR03843 family)